MKTTEKLASIVAHCNANLALAAKRTHGKWAAVSFARCVKPDDAAYIAACTSAAESGWRSTIAAIDLCQRHGWVEGRFVETIIAAWEANHE